MNLLGLVMTPRFIGKSEISRWIGLPVKRSTIRMPGIAAQNKVGYIHRIVSWLGRHQGELTVYIVLHTFEFLSVIAPRKDIAVGTDSRQPLAVCLVQVLLNPLAVNLVGSAVTR